jgi:hypothetical protein
MTEKYRVVSITNNLAANPECREDTEEFPDLVEAVEDETGHFVVRVLDNGEYESFPAHEFFSIVNVTEFTVEWGDE